MPRYRAVSSPMLRERAMSRAWHTPTTSSGGKDSDASCGTLRANQRYEARVLGLLRDAWIESELRTRQDGAPEVEWFIFGDDDTWWSDPAMLRELVSQYDHRQDHIMGTFSETVGNYQVFGASQLGR